MSHRKSLKFEAKDAEFVSLGNASTNIRLTHEIAPEQFIKIYESICSQYNLQITEEFIKRLWEEETFFGVKRKAQIANIIPYIIDFVLDAHYLLGKGIEIGPLIKEFKASGHIGELRHACSLSFLSSMYASKKYTVQFEGKSKGEKPDLFVNKIPADLKVIRQSDLEKIHRCKGRVFESKLSEDLCYDIGKSIQNRLHEGIKQAELVFIDLTAKSLSSIWLGEEFDTLANIIPEPKRFRVVYFCKMGPNVFIGRKQTYSFFATYIDIEPNLWDFIKRSDKTITHTMIGGPPNI